MTAVRALAWGLVAAIAWVTLAALSGAWSPLAGRPLLDGLIPGAAYRWVEPPPELAADNEPPAADGFEIVFRDGESEADVVFTADNQVTLVTPQGVVRDSEARTLRIGVTPRAPSSLGALPGELEPFGNAVHLEAATTPGGPVATFDQPVTAVLVYPATPNLHATSHEILWSVDGSAWAPLGTTDAPLQQQAQAEIAQPGFLVVAGIPTAAPSPGDGSDGGTRATLSTILLVVAGASLLIGIGLLLRARNAGA